jgi:hypothetical protein
MAIKIRKSQNYSNQSVGFHTRKSGGGISTRKSPVEAPAPLPAAAWIAFRSTDDGIIYITKLEADQFTVTDQITLYTDGDMSKAVKRNDGSAIVVGSSGSTPTFWSISAEGTVGPVQYFSRHETPGINYSYGRAYDCVLCSNDDIVVMGVIQSGSKAETRFWSIDTLNSSSYIGGLDTDIHDVRGISAKKNSPSAVVSALSVTGSFQLGYGHSYFTIDPTLNTLSPPNLLQPPIDLTSYSIVYSLADGYPTTLNDDSFLCFGTFVSDPYFEYQAMWHVSSSGSILFNEIYITTPNKGSVVVDNDNIIGGSANNSNYELFRITKYDPPNWADAENTYGDAAYLAGVEKIPLRRDGKVVAFGSKSVSGSLNPTFFIYDSTNLTSNPVSASFPTTDFNLTYSKMVLQSDDTVTYFGRKNSDFSLTAWSVDSGNQITECNAPSLLSSYYLFDIGPVW